MCVSESLAALSQQDMVKYRTWPLLQWFESCVRMMRKWNGRERMQRTKGRTKQAHARLCHRFFLFFTRLVLLPLRLPLFSLCDCFSICSCFPSHNVFDQERLLFCTWCRLLHPGCFCCINQIIMASQEHTMSTYNVYTRCFSPFVLNSRNHLIKQSSVQIIPFWRNYQRKRD